MCVVGTAVGMLMMMYGTGCGSLVSTMVDLNFERTAVAEYQTKLSSDALNFARDMSRRLYWLLNDSFFQNGNFSNKHLLPCLGGAGRSASAGRIRKIFLQLRYADNTHTNTTTREITRYIGWKTECRSGTMYHAPNTLMIVGTGIFGSV